MSQASNYMPDILQAANKQSAISVSRALKNALDIINEHIPDNVYGNDNVQAAIDDLNFMISRMASGRKMEIQSI